MEKMIGLVGFGMLLLQSCTHWDPGFALKGLSAPPIETSLNGVDAIFETADNATRLNQAIEGYSRVFPGSDKTLGLRLAEAHILYAAAYGQTKKDKAQHYRKGIQYAEWVMAQNPDFAAAVAGGQKVDEACQYLNQDDMKAMLLWVTGVSYYYKECLSGLSHVFHAGWMVQTKSVLTDYWHWIPNTNMAQCSFRAVFTMWPTRLATRIAPST